MRSLIRIIVVASSVFVITSCNRNISSEPLLDRNEVVLSEKTHIVSEQENSKLLSVEKNRIIYLSGGISDDVKVGSIIVSDITANAPGGFLRRVLSIENIDGKVILETEKASLNEAILEGKATNSIQITADDILEIELIDGTIITQEEIKKMSSSRVDVLRGTRAEWFPIRFEKEYVIYDEDGNKETSNDQIKMKGKTSFAIVTNFDYEKDRKGLKYLKVGIGMENESSLNVTAALKTPSLPKKVKEGITIGKIKLAPMSFYIGVIPVPYASQSIDLVVGLDASAKIQFQTELEVKNSINASLQYVRGEGIKPVFTPNMNTSNEVPLKYTPLELKLEGKVEPFLGIFWKADPYLLDAENSRLEAGPKASFPIVGTLNTTEAKLKMDFILSLHMLAKLGFVDKNFINYDEDWKMVEKNIFEKSFKWEQEKIPTDGLVAYYPFNGNANDESGNENHGVSHNTSLTQDRKNNINSAFYFNGSTAYISMKNSFVLPAHFSVSAWFNFEEGGFINPRIISLMNNIYASDGGLEIFTETLSGNRNLRVWHGEKESLYGYKSANDLLKAGQWYNVVLTYDGVKSSLYLNGELINHNFSNLTYSPTAYTMNIGRKSVRAYDLWKGAIDDIRIYNRTLSDSEIKVLYNE